MTKEQGCAVLGFLFDQQDNEVRLMGYLPGISQTDVALADTYYLHADHLGSTWFMSAPDGVTRVRSMTRTAFGEHVSGSGSPQTRYGYAGAWGYAEHDFASPADPDTPDGYPDSTFRASPTAGFPQQVGWRYYDPGSGRFLQQDPIGIRGGLNVYGYVKAVVTKYVDPLGLHNANQPPPSWSALAKDGMGSEEMRRKMAQLNGFPQIPPKPPPPVPSPSQALTCGPDAVEQFVHLMHYPDALLATAFIGGVGIPIGFGVDVVLTGTGGGWIWGDGDYEPGDITRGVLDGIGELWH